jgi:hypothetical protein
MPDIFSYSDYRKFPAAYEEICKVIQGAQETILDIAGKDRGSDTVYPLNFHLFPVSRTGNGQGKS